MYESAHPDKVDWNFEEERASKMDTEGLFYALKDAIEASFVSSNAGKYTDQASVYRRELENRGIHFPSQDKKLKEMGLKTPGSSQNLASSKKIVITAKKKRKKISQGIDPGDIDPETGNPYSNYSSPNLMDNASNEEFTEQNDPYPNKGNQYVSVYEVQRAYGGPEEGGWWYDAYQLVDTHPVATLEAAQKVKEFLKNKLKTENEQRGPLDSSRGFDSLPEGTEDWQIPRGFSGSASELVVIIEDEPGEHTTKEIPHYE